MTSPAELDQYVQEVRELTEELRMEIAVAREAAVKLRQTRTDVQKLLETDIPRVVAQAVALHISRSNVESRRNR